MESAILYRQLKEIFLKLKLRKGLDTVESLSVEASANLSANRNHLILLPAVKWYLFGCWGNYRAFE